MALGYMRGARVHVAFKRSWGLSASKKRSFSQKSDAPPYGTEAARDYIHRQKVLVPSPASEWDLEEDLGRIKHRERPRLCQSPWCSSSVHYSNLIFSPKWRSRSWYMKSGVMCPPFAPHFPTDSDEQHVNIFTASWRVFSGEKLWTSFTLSFSPSKGVPSMQIAGSTHSIKAQ